MTSQSDLRLGSRSIGAIIGVVALLALFTMPVLAQTNGPDVSGIVSLLQQWQNAIVRVFQVLLGLATVAFVGMAGLGWGGGLALRRIGIAVGAIVLLESYNQIFIEPAKQAGEGLAPSNGSEASPTPTPKTGSTNSIDIVTTVGDGMANLGETVNSTVPHTADVAMTAQQASHYAAGILTVCAP
jgi:hypothetical protein